VRRSWPALGASGTPAGSLGDPPLTIQATGLAHPRRERGEHELKNLAEPLGGDVPEHGTTAPTRSESCL
jgi:hypothetical protein